MAYEIDIVITLIDGTEQVEHAKINAPTDLALQQGLGQTIQQLGMIGVLKFDEKRREFVLDPAPSQIRRVTARIPSIITADLLPVPPRGKLTL